MEWAVWTMEYLHTECQRGAWDCRREQRRVLLPQTLNVPTNSREVRLNLFVKRDSELLWNSKGFKSVQSTALMNTGAWPLSTIRNSGYEHVKSSEICGYRTTWWKRKGFVPATISSLFVVWEKQKEKVSSLSIALATPVSSTVVHIAILWVGYHRNCPSQTRQ